MAPGFDLFFNDGQKVCRRVAFFETGLDQGPCFFVVKPVGRPCFFIQGGNDAVDLRAVRRSRTMVFILSFFSFFSFLFVVVCWSFVGRRLVICWLPVHFVALIF